MRGTGAVTQQIARATALAVVLILSQHGVASSAQQPDSEPQVGAGVARPQDDATNPLVGAASGIMTYHGGPVQRSQKVFTIFWNPGTPFPFGYQATINQFVQDLNGSSYYAIASQYSDQTGPIGTTLTFGGTWFDTTTPFPETALSSSDLAAEVSRAKAANGWTSDGNSYFQIYTPVGITSSFGGICGVHWFGNPAIGHILFPTAGCLPGSAPYPNDQFADAAINTSAHEIMETLTDPLGNAWFYQNSSGEIGDLCNFNFGPRSADGGNVTLGGHRYLVQQQYSNADAACVLSLTTPLVVTGTASAIAPFSATLNGTVDPRGANVSAYFQYGLTTGYGTTTVPQTIAPDGGVTAIGGGSVSGLACGSLYHFRAVALNGSGSWQGADSTFMTTQCGTTTSWVYQDVGAVGIAGSATSSNGQFNVTSAGSDIWGTADSFGYVYQPFSGDGNVSTGVVSVQNTNLYAKGGVMLRTTLDPSSAFVILDIRPDGEIEFMARPHGGEPVMFIAGGSVSFSSSPRLLLTREDGVITGYLGVGAGWQAIGSVADTMPRDILAGMAVTSHDTSMLNTTVFQSPASHNFTFGLPQGWIDQDIGAVGKAGGSMYQNGVFTVQGAGADIWGTADSFHMVEFAPFPDGSSIVARVTHVDNTNPFAKAGVMLVLDDKAGASNANVVLDVKPTGDVEFMMRRSSGASTEFLAGVPVQMPIWLKLTLTGTAVSGYTSPDGVNWTLIGSASPDFAEMQANNGEPFVGLVVTSHDTSQINTSTFDNVSVTLGGSTLPAYWASHDVGATGVTGSASYAGGIFTVRGAGADIWGTSDAFQFLSETFTDSGTLFDEYPLRHAEIVARVTSTTPTNTFAKAGVMIRDSDDPGSVHVILDVRPTGDIEFMTRTATGASTTYIGGTNVGLPIWLKLARAGATVTGYVSSDGLAWTMVGTTTTALSNLQTELGLIVTSHDTSAVNTSTFDSVDIRLPR